MAHSVKENPPRGTATALHYSEVQAALKRSGLTQRQIAQGLNCTESWVSRCIRGEKSSEAVRMVILDLTGYDLAEIHTS